MIIFINDRKVPPSWIEQAGRKNVLMRSARSSFCRQAVGWSIVGTMMHINTLRFLGRDIQTNLRAGHRLSRTDDERAGDERTLLCQFIKKFQQQFQATINLSWRWTNKKSTGTIRNGSQRSNWSAQCSTQLSIGILPLALTFSKKIQQCLATSNNFWQFLTIPDNLQQA